MKLSWNFLNNILKLENINIKQLINKLTLAGLEVEDITYNNLFPDTFIKIDITANRGDLNGFIQIATEISALLNLPIQLPPIDSNKNNKLSINNDIYTVENVNIKNLHLQHPSYLENLDLNKTHTILDTVQLINLKWGQKIELYYLKAPNNRLNSDNNKQIKDPQTIYRLNRDLYCQINAYNINEIKENFFVFINKQEINTYSIYAYQELFNLLKIQPINITNIPGTLNKSPSQERQKTIICNTYTIRKILGPIFKENQSSNFPVNYIIHLLTTLKFQVKKTLKKLIVSIPKERVNDIKHEIDIIEEIGRIYGFEYFQDRLPLFKKNRGPIQKKIADQTIRRVLRSSGLHEVIHYSLIKNSKDIKDTIIINPLNQDLSFLRRNLLESLIRSKKYNLDKKNESFEVFEIGTIFKKNLKKSIIIESKHLCCVLGCKEFNRLNWRNKSSELNWYQAKGQVEEIFEKLKANIYWSNKLTRNNFIGDHCLKEYIHTNRYIYINNRHKTIGIFSQLNNFYASKLDISNTTYFLEIDIIELNKTVNKKTHLNFTFAPYPQYPRVTRDISLKFRNETSMMTIEEKINKIIDENTSIIESVKIINEYYNNKGIKTLCLRIIYRSPQKTLTNQEVNILDNIFKENLNFALKSKT